MKKIKVVSLFLIVVLTLAMFAGCGKKDNSDEQTDQSQTVTQEEATSTAESTSNAVSESAQTLESYLAADKTTSDSIQQMAEQNKMTITVVGNTLTYIYDLEKAMSLDKDTALSNDVKEQLEQGLDDQTSTFQGVCDTLESATDIKGIKVVVRYTHGSDVIIEREFYAN